MAEGQSIHRQDLERARVEATNRTEHRGQIFAFVIALAAILGGVYLISIDKDASGLTAIVSALVALVGVFVYGRRVQAKEREDKRRAFEESQAPKRQLELFDNEGSETPSAKPD